MTPDWLPALWPLIVVVVSVPWAVAFMRERRDRRALQRELLSVRARLALALRISTRLTAAELLDLIEDSIPHHVEVRQALKEIDALAARREEKRVDRLAARREEHVARLEEKGNRP